MTRRRSPDIACRIVRLPGFAIRQQDGQVELGVQVILERRNVIQANCLFHVLFGAMSTLILEGKLEHRTNMS